MGILEFNAIKPEDYENLTKIMTDAFNEDTSIHTDIKEDGPNGYNDGTLIKKLNEHEGYESFKIIYNKKTAGAYTVSLSSKHEYVLEMIFLDTKLRGLNLGTELWNKIEASYPDAVKWTLETPDYSKRNHHFYTSKCGFKFVRENLCSNGAKSFVFEKILKNI